MIDNIKQQLSTFLDDAETWKEVLETIDSVKYNLVISQDDGFNIIPLLLNNTILVYFVELDFDEWFNNDSYETTKFTLVYSRPIKRAL